MSTSETVNFDIGNCPCGKGKIVKSVTTQDNPWSSADIRFSIECLSCDREWRIQNECLVNKRSEVPYAAAQQEERLKYDALRQFIDPLVDLYFLRFAAKTKKAEHAEMLRLGITTDSYQGFLKEKAKSKPYSEICFALRNREWLCDLARQSSLLETLTCVVSEYDDAKRRTSDAYGHIIRQSIPT
jgi:hypothetical protein